MFVMEGQGVDGHMVTFFCFFMFIFFHDGLKWCYSRDSRAVL